MLSNFFSRKSQNASLQNEMMTLTAPLAGEVIALRDVVDPVFAQGMVGDGIAILPFGHEVCAPIDGTVTTLLASKHAVGITTSDGIELLIHVGIDSVELKGEGFVAYIEQGQEVKQGQKLLDVDLTVLREKAKSMQTPFIITNVDQVEIVERAPDGPIQLGDVAMVMRKRG